MHPSSRSLSPAVRVWLCALLGLVLALTLVGCGTGRGGQAVLPSTDAAVPQGLDVDAVDAVVIAAAATANTPAPQLSPLTATLLGGALERGVPVHVVHVQGTPTLADDLTFRGLGGTEAGNEAVTRSNLRKVATALSVAPTSDGADYLGGLLLAVDKARAAGARHPLVILLGSGLSDTGDWDLTVPGMLGADAGEVLASLGADYPGDRLAGVDVVLSGIGWTAPGQEPLSDGQRTTVRDLWVGVVSGMGGSAFLDVEPFTADPVDTTHTVRPVALTGAVEPDPTPSPGCRPQEIVLDQTSAVSFVADEAELVDPAAAAVVLDALAARMLQDDALTAVVRGTTANVGSMEAQRSLGLARARVVVDYLTDAGVPAARFTKVVGIGSAFDEYVTPDRDGAGVLLPGPAALNRSVRVSLTQHC